MIPVDKDLLRAYIKREARDFPPGRIDNEGHWVEYRMEKIEDILSHSPKVSDIRFVSIGNTGVLLRELRLEPSPDLWNGKGPVLVVTFCNCGKDACWGGHALVWGGR